MLQTVKRRAKRFLIDHYERFGRLLPKGHHAFPFEGGEIYLDVRESPMMLARARGLYEPEKKAALQTFLPDGGHFVDVGANKGDFSLIAARRASRVDAFEPAPENCLWIRRSLALNGYDNVNLWEAALSDDNGEAPLYLGAKSGWHTLVPGQARRDKGVVTVQVHRLDDALAGSRPNVMKIDVEGAELEVLRGARQILADSGPVLLLDVHPNLGVDPGEVEAELRELGYACFEMTPPFAHVPRVGSETRELLARRDTAKAH